MKTKNIFSLLFFSIVASNIFAQTNITNNIYLSDTRFPYPIIEKWIAEYQKIKPDFRISLSLKKQNTDSVNLRVIAYSPLKNNIASDEEFIQLNRYALLPATSANNPNEQNRNKNGFSQADFKRYFFTDNALAFEDNPGSGKIYNVYVPTEQAGASITFAQYFGFKPSEIKGKKISGDEKYLILAIQKDITGLTFNYPGYLYDRGNRLIQSGITILPVDINNNGTIDKEEKTQRNLDELLGYLEQQNNINNIPLGDIGFVININKIDPGLKGFIEWITTEGQKYNHEFGFLNRIDYTGIKEYQTVITSR
jgi:phosphate transport system substrate-binding protein